MYLILTHRRDPLAISPVNMIELWHGECEHRNVIYVTDLLLDVFVKKMQIINQMPISWIFHTAGYLGEIVTGK